MVVSASESLEPSVETAPSPRRHRVVVVGGGFGGLAVARSLRSAPVEVVLVDRRNHHLFQPLLYQVATGGLSPANISAPIRHILRRQRNATVLLSEVTGFDLGRKEIVLGDRREPYDSLVIATGVESHYFGNEEWEGDAPGLKSIDDATEIRRRVLHAFEMAELSDDPDEIAQWLTFVIVGAGPTGVEMAGTLAEVARDTLRRDFRRIDPTQTRVILVEGGPDVLASFPAPLPAEGRRALESLGVEVRTDCRVEGIDADEVQLRHGDHVDRIAARTVVWAAGVRAGALASALAEAADSATDRMGRLTVTEQLHLPEHPDVYVVGDVAHSLDEDGEPLPGIAPVAMQQGAYVATRIRDRLEERRTPPFRYRDRGSMATIGRAAAVADFGWLRLTGFPAWFSWLFIHLFFLIGFENRLLVMFQWAWNYVTYGRSARLITEGGGTSGVKAESGDPAVPPRAPSRDLDSRPENKYTNAGPES